MSEHSTAAPAPADAHGVPPGRRNFLIEAAAVAVGAIITVIPGMAAITFVLNPLYPKPKKAVATQGAGGADDGFRRVGNVSSLVAGGPPVYFPVNGIKVDAWTTYPETAIGAVYVRMLENGDLECLNARCTHLGCTVKYRPEQTCYVCPCHTSSFSVNGARMNEIPPRAMDSLTVERRNKNEIWVKFQNFRGGKEEKIPV